MGPRNTAFELREQLRGLFGGREVEPLPARIMALAEALDEALGTADPGRPVGGRAVGKVRPRSR